MELWIRSQDKEKLIKASTLFVEYNGDVDPTINSYKIVADKCIDLGIYKSRKRALEVLNEIHQRLINLETLKIAPDSYKVLPKDTSNVYEMPKE